MSLRDLNAVRGHNDWHYGLRIRQPDGTVFFQIVQDETGIVLGPIRASAYRTTTLARKMGETVLRGYEHAARDAILSRQRRLES